MRILAALVVSFILQAAATTTAQEPSRPSVYQPVGAPADPLVPARWNYFRDYAAATELLQQLAKAHPDRCRLQSLGQSYGKREMWLLSIGNLKQGPELEKPAFWIDGGIHANEVQATDVTLYTAWYLLESYKRSPLVTQLLDQRVFYVMPMMSPDSRDAHMYRPNTMHTPRSGQRPVDDDLDGLVDEDSPDDLDGNGHITQMRIRDPHGRFKPHADYPDLLIPCRADENGQYTLLNTEGIDNDGDGKIDEDGDGNYDPNRDWPWQWQPRHVQKGAHRYPLSVEENRLVADFITAHPNIAGAQSYHNAGGMILRGPGDKSEQYETADVAVYNEIARKGELMLPGYRYLEVGRDVYQMHGGEIDWLYRMQGIFAFTNELFTPANYFRQKSEGFFGKPEEQHRFNRYLLLGDGFVAWKPVDHPQYGKIEVGGFKKSWLRQPPSFLLEEECHRNMAFTLYHADQMPLVKVESVEVKPLADGLQEVIAVITNQRMTPTRARADVNRKITPPDRVTIESEGLKVILGMTDRRLTLDRPRPQKRRPAELRVDSVPGMGAVYVRWIVEGKPPFTVTARTAKGGVSRAVSGQPADAEK